MYKNTLTLCLLVSVVGGLCGCRSDRSVRARRIAKADAAPNAVVKVEQSKPTDEREIDLTRNSAPTKVASLAKAQQPATPEAVVDNVRLVKHEKPPEPIIGPALDAIQNPFVGHSSPNPLNIDELPYAKPMVKTAVAVKLERQNFTERDFQSQRRKTPAPESAKHDSTPRAKHSAESPTPKQESESTSFPVAAGSRVTNQTPESESLTPRQWEELLHECITLLETQNPDDDESNNAKNETSLRLLYVVAGQPEDAIKPVSHLNETEQEFLKELLYGLIVYFNSETTLENAQNKALVLQNLRRATDTLASLSNLEVRHAAFCTEVLSYGRYTEVDSPEFHAGEEVLLYAEIDNFKSEQIETNGQFETALLGSYEIRDLARRKVAQHEFPLEKETCRNRRRDFFIPYRMHIPNIKPGHYTLHLKIEDTKSKRIGQSAPIALMIKP